LQSNKKMPAQMPRKTGTIRDWVDRGPSSKVSRAELMRVLDGFGFIPREGVVVMFRDYDRIRHELMWYRRLWRWIKLRFKKKQLEDLTPEQRARVQHDLAEIDERAVKLTEEKVEAPALKEVYLGQDDDD